ncbi:hypothetical protein SEVIR_7G009652v4 [Setaria viridis]
MAMVRCVALFALRGARGQQFCLAPAFSLGADSSLACARGNCFIFVWHLFHFRLFPSAWSAAWHCSPCVARADSSFAWRLHFRLARTAVLHARGAIVSFSFGTCFIFVCCLRTRIADGSRSFGIRRPTFELPVLHATGLFMRQLAFSLLHAICLLA